MNGQTKQDLPSLTSNVTELAELLGITNFNIDAQDGTNRDVEEAEPLQREPGQAEEEKTKIKQEERSHCCAVCFKSFSSAVSLGFHYCKHFYDNLEHLELSDFIEAQAQTRCVPCKKTFPDREAVLSHVGVRHQRLNEVLRINGIDELELELELARRHQTET